MWHWIYQEALLLKQKQNLKSECILSGSKIMSAFHIINFRFRPKINHIAFRFCSSLARQEREVLIVGSKCV